MTTLKLTHSELELKKVLPPNEAGEYLGISPLTLANWRVVGKGPLFVRLSPRKIGYRISDLDKWLSERVFSSTTEADQVAR
ncbi:helix-turn-helix transcriptional regulator [Leptospirillum ferriphilum]|jgi:hypothetical protein|uniref:helix-turn-helix transcriptional regulator n=1 Tax=Leptospirillum ferriphilum TaxID=178606 RepID=UPI003EE42498